MLALYMRCYATFAQSLYILGNLMQKWYKCQWLAFATYKTNSTDLTICYYRTLYIIIQDYIWSLRNVTFTPVHTKILEEYLIFIMIFYKLRDLRPGGNILFSYYLCWIPTPGSLKLGSILLPNLFIFWNILMCAHICKLTKYKKYIYPDS